MLCHLKVCREYRDQERDEANTGEPSKARNEYAGTAEDFAKTADLYEQRMRRQPGRNDPYIKRRVQKMIAARSNKEDGEQRQ